MRILVTTSIIKYFPFSNVSKAMIDLQFEIEFFLRKTISMLQVWRVGGSISDTTEIRRPMSIGSRWSEAPNSTEPSDCTVYSHGGQGHLIQPKPEAIRPSKILLGKRIPFCALATVSTRLTAPKRFGVLNYYFFFWSLFLGCGCCALKYLGVSFFFPSWIFFFFSHWLTFNIIIPAIWFQFQWPKVTMKTVQFPGTAGLEAFVRPLTLRDLENCVEVESAFPEQERCSRQKVCFLISHFHGEGGRSYRFTIA